MHRSSLRWWVLSLIATGTALGVAYASQHGLAQQYYAVIALSAVQGALMLWIVRDGAFADLSLRQVLFTCALVAVAGLLAQPLLEDDHFRYLWDGYITATTGKPYAWAPAAYFENDAVPAVMQEVLSGINHPEVPTIYGPLLQVIFALGYWLAPAALWPLKLVLLCALLAVLWLLRGAGIAPPWLMVFALHPLVVKESAFTAHPDVLIGLVLLAAVLAWRRGMEGWAGALAGLAVAMKFSAVAVIPLFCIDRRGRFSTRGCLAMLVTLSLVYAPVWLSVAGGEGRALAALGGQWVFNPLLFKLAGAVMSDGAARMLVLVLFAVAWLAIALSWVNRLRSIDSQRYSTQAEHLPVPPVVCVLVALLLLSPVINPWYWLWILPLAVLRFSWVAWVAATVSLLAYAHVMQAVTSGASFTSFAVPIWATWVQLEAIALVLVLAYLGKKPRAR